MLQIKQVVTRMMIWILLLPGVGDAGGKDGWIGWGLSFNTALHSLLSGCINNHQSRSLRR